MNKGKTMQLSTTCNGHTQLVTPVV